MTEAEFPQRKRNAAYAPASVLSEFFDHIRYVQTPKKVDSNLVLDYGTSKSHAFALISALKFLGLTNDKGEPTPVFRQLQTGGDEFKNALNDVLKRAYHDLFERLDVSRDSRDKIVNFFARNYSPATAEKATALFLDLCGEAGIETAAKPRQKSPHKSPVTPKPIENNAPKNEGNEEDQQLPLLANTSGQTPKPQQKNTQVKGVVNKDTPPQKPPALEQHFETAGMSIKIDSKDLAAMNPQQIQAIFEGLSKIMKQNKEDKQ